MTRKNLTDCCEAVGSTGATAATAGGPPEPELPPEPEPEPGSDRPVGTMPAAFRTLMALYCWAIAVRCLGPHPLAPKSLGPAFHLVSHANVHAPLVLRCPWHEVEAWRHVAGHMYEQAVRGVVGCFPTLWIEALGKPQRGGRDGGVLEFFFSFLDSVRR